MHKTLFLAQLSELFIYAGQYAVCLSVCLCVCVCLDVNEGGPDHNHCTQRLVILHAQTN